MKRNAIAVLSIIGIVLLFAASPVDANFLGRSDDKVGASSDDGRVGARAEGPAELDGPASQDGQGNVPIASSNYDPPPCWYVSKYSPDEMKRYIRDWYFNVSHIPGISTEEYMKWEKSFGDYHKSDKGKWYVIECSDPRSDAAIEWSEGKEPFLWIAADEPSPAGSIDPRDLARYAREALLPAPAVQAPASRTAKGPRKAQVAPSHT